MRRIGTLTDKKAADQFALFLQTQGLQARRDETADGTEFWVFDEDRLDAARADLERYREGNFTPIALPPKVEAAPRRPVTIPVDHRSQDGRWNKLRSAPFTVLLLGACVAASLATGFFHVPTRYSEALGIIPMQVSEKGGSFRFDADDPFLWFAKGEVWRLFTPALIHANALHLLMNMQVVYVFGGVIERVRGSWRMIGLTLFSGVASNLAQYWWSGPMFCGISGVGYALYGYIWMKSLFQPSTGFRVPASLHWMFWIWTAICFSGLLPIANAAHSAGLAAGILYGLIPFL